MFILLALLQFALGSAPLRDAIGRGAPAPPPAAPTQAQLFATCAISPDGTTLNGMVCNSDITYLAAGCLDKGHAYGCNADSGTWIVLTQ